MAPQAKSFGFLTMAFGPEKYMDQAKALAMSLKLHMPGIPIAIITDHEGAQPLFDITVPMGAVKVAGTVHKKEMYEMTPFDHTLFIDSDCLVSRPFTDELNEISQYEFTPVVTKYTEKDGTDLYIENMSVALEGVKATKFPKFNGGIYFFKKGARAAEIFERASNILPRQAELGIRNFDKSGPGEETIIGLALGALGYTKLYNDRGRLMRTPLNMSGRLKFDVLGGGCSFIKEGELVTPAICHFCGPWASSAAYRLAIRAVSTGKSPSFIRRRFEYGADMLSTFNRRLKRKWQHLTQPRPQPLTS